MSFFLVIAVFSSLLGLVAWWIVSSLALPSGGNAQGRDTVRLAKSNDFDYDIVGESNYQDALERIAGPKMPEGVEHECSAFLSPEPTNRHDPKAIKVTIDGRTVGYVPRGETTDFHRILRGRRAEVAALIVGGWDRGDRGKGHYGVKLDIDYPPRSI
jgi:hypothetical protein